MNLFHNPAQPCCPFCGRVDAIFHQGSQRWAVCHADRLVWYVGTHLDESWRLETLAYQQMQLATVQGYRLVVVERLSGFAPIPVL